MLYLTNGLSKRKNLHNANKNLLAEMISNNLCEVFNNEEFSDKINSLEPSWEIESLDFNELDIEKKKLVIDRISNGFKSEYNLHGMKFLGLWKISNGSGYMLVCHTDRKINFEASAQKERKLVDEHRVSIFEYNNKGTNQGIGEIIYVPNYQDEYFLDKPRPSMTKTFDGFAQKGLGKQRILNMNILSKAIFGLKLYSANSLLTYAENVRLTLIEEGKAEKYLYVEYGEKKRRYRFIK